MPGIMLDARDIKRNKQKKLLSLKYTLFNKIKIYTNN